MGERDSKPFTPEEKASYRAWSYGSALDWASLILAAIGYPVELNRWFVDAVCGIYQRNKLHFAGAAVPIAHGTIAKRAKKFKSKVQAGDLVRAALERDAEWARKSRMMILDVERPKPHEREGKDKRARTKYTDFLTPAAVWARDSEQTIKKADPAAWKSSKYRGEKRAEILAGAVKMLPQFKSVEDMPASVQEARCVTCEKAREDGDETPRFKKDCPGHPTPLSEYVKQRQAVGAAERRRIVDKLACETLTDTKEIDERLALLDTYYSREKVQLEKDYASARAVLLGMRSTRLITPARFIDPEEVAAEVDARLGSEAEKGDLPGSLFEYKKGGLEPTLLVQTPGPLSSTPSSGSNGYKGVRA